MRILFVAYCIISNGDGDSLIGVYKRCLRIGLEMHRRGHEVHILCDRRHEFRDPLVKETAKIFHFIDLPGGVHFMASEKVRRRYLRARYSEANLDMVVIGECPLGGSLLDAAVVASELELPMVLLDNAYSPIMVKLFMRRHAALFDGVILTGPQSFHPAKASTFYCGVPPLLAGDPAAALPLLEELKLDAGKLITVLGYEHKAEILATNLLLACGPTDNNFLFIVRRPQETLRRLEVLPSEVREKVRVIPLPSESTLFSLLKHSSLAIGKCGFMQVSESLALGTPFLAVFYKGCFSTIAMLPRAQRYVHSTIKTEADASTLAAFERLLHANAEDLSRLHDGRFDGLSRTADFLENMLRIPRTGVTEETERLGYRKSKVTAALERKHPGKQIEIEWMRGMRMGDSFFGHTDCLAIAYRCAGVRRFTTLCGRKYWSLLLGRMLLRRATTHIPEQRILYRGWGGRFTIEEDRRESYVPPPGVGGGAGVAK